MRIAMWSGPRNLSTAMMYSFGNRSDFSAWDEPFYAAYLQSTGSDHPLSDEIIAAHDSDPLSVAANCLSPLPKKRPNFYMKHMAHHMMHGFPLDWARSCTNIHLIRHPARVVASYSEKRENPTLDDIGFQQQLRVFEKLGGLVIDSADIRNDPKGMLEKLCSAIGLVFDPAMLSWPAGRRSYDGIWAQHWYNSVHQTTGFAGPERPLPSLSTHQNEIVRKAMPIYDQLSASKLVV